VAIRYRKKKNNDDETGSRFAISVIFSGGNQMILLRGKAVCLDVPTLLNNLKRNS
jgi:hypothetical protein